MQRESFEITYNRRRLRRERLEEIHRQGVGTKGFPYKNYMVSGAKGTPEIMVPAWQEKGREKWRKSDLQRESFEITYNRRRLRRERLEEIHRQGVGTKGFPYKNYMVSGAKGTPEIMVPAWQEKGREKWRKSDLQNFLVLPLMYLLRFMRWVHEMFYRDMQKMVCCKCFYVEKYNVLLVTLYCTVHVYCGVLQKEGTRCDTYDEASRYLPDKYKPVLGVRVEPVNHEGTRCDTYDEASIRFSLLDRRRPATQEEVRRGACGEAGDPKVSFSAFATDRQTAYTRSSPVRWDGKLAFEAFNKENSPIKYKAYDEPDLPSLRVRTWHVSSSRWFRRPNGTTPMVLPSNGTVEWNEKNSRYLFIPLQFGCCVPPSDWRWIGGDPYVLQVCSPSPSAELATPVEAQAFPNDANAGLELGIRFW
ncbi:hypothetical protein M5K25_019047 [Dendrobium thyrsiflorum]|uniref:Uncharacterized protein n=1 Tax=Dendrobium thyrsiflorum TaxID=117978 RepID=A0ABD0UDX7_DENTH